MTYPHSSDDSDTPDSLLESVSLLSRKWHPLVVRALSGGNGLGYSDIERRLDGISAKVLTDALEELEEYEIINREEVSQSPLRVNYTLTARGEELDGIIDSLAEWGETYLAEPDTEQVVLVADDDSRFLLMYEEWLADEYTVRTANDGEQALRNLDTDIGVIVLDRRMPGLSGGEVLDWVRSQRYDIRVVMITAEDPTIDVLDMDFDEYLTKPVFEDELLSVVAELFERHEYSTQLREYLSLRSKQVLLEAGTPSDSLETSDEYEALQNRLSELEEMTDDIDAVAPERLETLSLTRHQ